MSSRPPNSHETAMLLESAAETMDRQAAQIRILCAQVRVVEIFAKALGSGSGGLVAAGDESGGRPTWQFRDAARALREHDAAEEQAAKEAAHAAAENAAAALNRAGSK